MFAGARLQADCAPSHPMPQLPLVQQHKLHIMHWTDTQHYTGVTISTALQDPVPVNHIAGATIAQPMNRPSQACAWLYTQIMLYTSAAQQRVGQELQTPHPAAGGYTSMWAGAHNAKANAGCRPAWSGLTEQMPDHPIRPFDWALHPHKLRPPVLRITRNAHSTRKTLP